MNEAIVVGAGLAGLGTARELRRHGVDAIVLEAGAAIVANVRSYDFVANALAFRRPLLVLWGGRDHAVNVGLKVDIGPSKASQLGSATRL